MPEVSQEKFYDIPMSEILSDSKFNCRGEIIPADVIDLARSIATIGMQQPIVVQPWNRDGYKYRIVSGHRRHMAQRINKADTITAKIVEGLSELEAKKWNLAENIKRKALNIYQEAMAIKDWVDADWTMQQIANELEMSYGWVQARVALLKLPEEIQQEAAAGFLTQDHIKQLAGIKDKEMQFEAVKKIKNSKQLGEKKKIVIGRKKVDYHKKKAREPEEIFRMQEIIQDVVGNNFGTRCLAWAAGEISDYDLLEDLKAIADEKKIMWNLPQEAKASKVTW